MSFIGLKERHGKVNREPLSQVLRMCDLGGKLLNGVNSMYVNILACVRVKRAECECLRFISGVRQGCIMSPWLFNVYMDAGRKEVKIGWGWSDISGGGERGDITWSLVCR